MEYLNEINENLHNLRETNKTLKYKLKISDKQLSELKQINLDQQKRIAHLESLIGGTIDAQTKTTTKVEVVDANANKVEIIDNSEYCDKSFERVVSDLSLQAVKLGFANYAEIANYLKQEIRAKTGLECFVSVGQRSEYCTQNWLHKNRKYVALKVGSLLIVVNQMNIKFVDILSNAKYMPISEVKAKSVYIDQVFEEEIVELAKHIVMNSGFKSSIGIADFLKDEINNKYGRIYGTNWFVTVGYGPYYDVSYCVKNSKRKFIDFLINELRFTVFQTL